MNPVTLLVTYRLAPETAGQFLCAVERSGVLELIRQEEGCLQYDYFTPTFGRDQILLVERWTSAAHQQRHLAQPHMALLRQAKERYVQETQVLCLTEG